MARSPEMKPARRGGRRARLSRERVVHAGMALADEAGLEAMTMQAVGDRLGVEAMSLYRHVRNKEDLVGGMIDEVFSQIEVPDDAPDWQTAMRRRAFSIREVLARHPWAAGMLESPREPGPANLRYHDTLLKVLLAAGFSSLMATRVGNILDSYVYGFAIQERSLPVATPEAFEEMGEDLIGQMPGDEYPHLRAVGMDLMTARFDYRAEFAIGLDLILDALDQLPRT